MELKAHHKSLTWCNILLSANNGALRPLESVLQEPAKTALFHFYAPPGIYELLRTARSSRPFTENWRCLILGNRLSRWHRC
jgi:hypothetical protein